MFMDVGASPSLRRIGRLLSPFSIWALETAEVQGPAQTPLAALLKEVSGAIENMCVEHAKLQPRIAQESDEIKKLAPQKDAPAITKKAKEIASLISGCKSLLEAVAVKIAKSCFLADGTIDSAAVSAIVGLLTSAANYLRRNHLPILTVLVEQNLAVLRVLLDDYGTSSGLAAVLLEAARDTRVGESGLAILKFMRKNDGAGSEFGLHVAILASLLTVHRQMHLPTCALDSLISEVTIMRPCEMAVNYLKLLRSRNGVTIILQAGGRQFTLASQNVAMEDGKLTPVVAVTPSAYAPFFSCGKRLPIGMKIDWIYHGIGYSLKGGKSTIKLPVRTITDLFFADFMQCVFEFGVTPNGVANFGAKVEEIYFGRARRANAAIKCDSYVFVEDARVPAFSSGNVSRMCYEKSTRFIGSSSPRGGVRAICTSSPARSQETGPEHHMELLYGDLLSLEDINAMNDGDVRIIGDRNWGLGCNVSCSAIKCVIVLGMSGIRAKNYIFGTLDDGGFKADPIYEMEIFD
jgi:hypothetical protein